MAKLTLSKHFIKNKIDDRIYSSFLEHIGSAIYGGIYDPGHPKADEDGYRLDVLEQIQRLRLPAIRYPGGNFTCSYNWEDTIGPASQRPARLELAWRQIEPNTFGIPEFMKWVKKTGADPIFAVNMGTRDIKDAAEIVEYFNIEKGTYFSDLRRSHGQEEPYGVKMWCVGNENDGPWQIARRRPDDYGWVVAESAKAMKRVDPSLELIAVGSSAPDIETFMEWDRQMLDAAYEYIDYVALHQYAYEREGQDLETYFCRAADFEDQIHAMVSVCDYMKARKHSKKTLYLSFDEYNVIAPSVDDYYEHMEIGYPIFHVHFTMRHALLFGMLLMAIIRNSDRVRIACQSVLVNVSGLVNTDNGSGAWLNTTYYPMLHASLYGRGRVLYQEYAGPSYQNERYGEVPAVDSIAVYREEEEEITVFAVNRTAEPVEFETMLHDFGRIEPIEHISMHHEDLEAVNNAENPDRVKPETLHDIACDKNGISCPLPAYSWNVIRVSCKGGLNG